MNHCILNQLEIPKDIDFLYETMNANDQFLFSTKLKFSTYQSFKHWLLGGLNNKFHDFFIVRDLITNIEIGYVYNYDFSLQNGHCKLVVYICPKYRKTGVGAFATVDFISYLFETYPLRKLYSTIYEYNSESLKCNRSAGFVEEGVLKDYRYYNGELHNIHYLSLSRQTYEQRMRKWI